MALTDLAPWRSRRAGSEMATLQDAMNGLFEDFTRGFAMAPARWPEMMPSFNPKVDVTEDDREVKVTAELPGMDEKDVEISLMGEMLTIKGEKRAEHEERKKGAYRCERTWGAFERTLPLPSEVDADRVQATFKKGVLNVTLAKTPTAQSRARKISIKT